jgi:beta-galactosidase
MVPHEGPDTPVFREISALGATLRDRSPVTVTAPVALIYDEQTMWALQAPHLPDHPDYEATVRRWHRALGPGPIDVVPPDAPLDRYETVVAPMLYLMPAAVHRSLRAFAAAGGHLVLTPGCGLVDEHCRVTPGALDDLIGARVLDPWHGAGEPSLVENRYGAGTVRYLTGGDLRQALGPITASGPPRPTC